MILDDGKAEKEALRKKCLEMRSQMNLKEKEVLDGQIFEHITNSSLFCDAKIILCYISTPFEVDTRKIITTAVEGGKIVAVPLCTKQHRRMDFYKIDCLDNLDVGAFNILQPKPQRDCLVTDYTNALCLTPGLAFDITGNRIGYGGGYYDCFLAKEAGIKTLGMCYKRFLLADIPCSSQDKACDYLVCEDGLIKVSIS